MPGPRSGRLAHLSSCAGLGLSALWLVACYRPNIQDGGFRCNLDAGASHACPEGYSCDTRTVPPLCYNGPHDGGVQDVPAEMGPEVQPEAGMEAPTSCFDARPACDPSDAGTCDPYCQSGCTGCRDKCTVASVDGGARYMCLAVPTNPVNELGMCDPIRDSCGPGLVCMDDNCGDRCYRYCRSDGDCPGASCSNPAPGGLMACDVPNVDCNPMALSAGGQTGCPTTSQGCYISSTHPDHTVCDCTGGGSEKTPCTRSRSCLPGLLCVDPIGSGSKLCLRVCLRSNASNCTPDQTCQQYVGSTTTNTPNPTYGFCY
jgi:hypothetical protein